MLINDLYQLTKLQLADSIIDAGIILNSDHAIFIGHYPGQPILPGACMLQILKEVLEESLSAKLLMAHAPQIKFLAMVDPHQTNEMKFAVNYKSIDNSFRIKASLTCSEVIHFKFNGIFKRL